MVLVIVERKTLAYWEHETSFSSDASDFQTVERKTLVLVIVERKTLAYWVHFQKVREDPFNEREEVPLRYTEIA